MSSCLADDNGAYANAGTSSKHFSVEFTCMGKIKSSKMVHVENDRFYYRERVKGKNQYEKVFVDKERVYQLTRRYHRNKANPSLTHTVAYVSATGRIMKSITCPCIK